MNKHQFTDAETFGVWKHWKGVCYYCAQPVRIQEASIDHFIPEHLLDKPEDLARVLRAYNLDDSFQINDFCNWLPCHLACNQHKGAAPLATTFQAMAIVDKLLRDAPVVKRIADGMIQNVKKGTLLAKVRAAKVNSILTKEDLRGFEWVMGARRGE